MNDKTKTLGEILLQSGTVNINEADPKKHQNYIENVTEKVNIPIMGGDYKLTRKNLAPIFVSRSEVKLDKDPLLGHGAINLVYRNKALAISALKRFSVGSQVNVYTYYIGSGNHIWPTTISDTSAPRLCSALRQLRNAEVKDAKASADAFTDLLFWYVGARFPLRTMKSSGAAKPPAKGAPAATPPAKPSPGAGSTAVKSVAPAASAGKAIAAESKIVFVEIGAGDLKASLEVARKGKDAVRVIAVDPHAPAAAAVRELESLGGTFIKGTAQNLQPSTAHYVFQYFPWRIGEAGSMSTGGTWRLVDDALKLLKPRGAAHFVTEHKTTAEYLVKEASRHNVRAVLTETTAGAAASGASGAGVPNFSEALKVWLVNIYK